MKKLSLFLVALTMVLVSCKPEQPKVVTTEVAEITVNSAVCGGGVSDGGGATIVERGFCWNIERKPTVLDFCVKDTEGGLGSFAAEITGLNYNTQYYVRAFAVNANGVAGYGEEVSFTTLDPTNGYEYVDLGLSVKWATCNVGANNPDDYGDYFAWGETIIKSSYTFDNSKTYVKTMNDISGNAQYDVARANCGGDWRMPTYAEMRELQDRCTWTWTTQNGVKGYKVKGPNGNSIFLPAAGYRNGSSLYNAGSNGRYWSSTPDEDCAYSLDFSSSYYAIWHNGPVCGLSVRPVLE